jgi:hypothetical protein
MNLHSSSVLFDDAYSNVKRVQASIGMQRLRLGALLCVLEQSGEWEGRTHAKSFRRFLIEEGIEPKAAYQYMRVAETFVLRLNLPVEELRKIASSSMRVLTAAAKVANTDNVLQLVDIVSSMLRPEALETIRHLYGDEPEKVQESFSKPVASILDKVGELTLDDRALLYQKLKVALPANVR